MACLVILRVRFNVNTAVWWESKRKPPVAALFLIILRKPNDRERAFIDHSADLIVTGMLRGPSSSAASRTETFSDPVNHPPWTSYGKKVAEYLPLCGLRPPIWSSPIKSVIYLLKILDYQTNSIYIQITKTGRNFNHFFVERPAMKEPCSVKFIDPMGTFDWSPTDLIRNRCRRYGGRSRGGFLLLLTGEVEDFNGSGSHLHIHRSGTNLMRWGPHQMKDWTCRRSAVTSWPED